MNQWGKERGWERERYKIGLRVQENKIDEIGQQWRTRRRGVARREKTE